MKKSQLRELIKEELLNEELTKSDFYFLEKLQREWNTAVWNIGHNLRLHSDEDNASWLSDDYLNKVQEANAKRLSIQKSLVQQIYKLTKIKLDN